MSAKKFCDSSLDRENAGIYLQAYGQNVSFSGILWKYKTNVRTYLEIYVT